MAETPQIVVTVLGDKLPLAIDVDTWTFEEARMAKQYSNGLAPLEILARLGVADPDAWEAILRVSMHRQGRRMSAVDLNQVNVSEIASAVRDAWEESRDRPPEVKPEPEGNGAVAAEAASSLVSQPEPSGSPV